MANKALIHPLICLSIKGSTIVLKKSTLRNSKIVSEKETLTLFKIRWARRERERERERETHG